MSECTDCFLIQCLRSDDDDSRCNRATQTFDPARKFPARIVDPVNSEKLNGHPRFLMYVGGRSEHRAPVS